MSTARYENKEAILYLDVQDVEQILCHLISEDNVPEAAELLEKIHSHPADLIPIKSSYFPFIILDLFKEDRGSIQCKICRKTYPARDLKLIPIGSGENPFSVKQWSIQEKGGILNRLFSRRFHISTFGGESYLCQEGHELISVIAWIN